jgi:GNAT superfamily N-acetyltransferase
MGKERARVGDVVITEIELATITDEEIAETNEFGNILRAESRPEDPPRPVELTAANIRNIPAFISVRPFIARSTDGALIGSGDAVVMRTDDNQHLMQAEVNVLPDHRRRGIGRALLRLIVEVAEEEKRTLIMGGTSERVPAGEAFARVVGAEAGSAQHINRLALTDLDAALIGKWIDEGPGRAPGYSLMTLDGPYPEDMYDTIAGVHNIMNTAPRDDLQMEDFKVTVEHMREWERSMEASGDKRWSIFARHDATGELIGFTEITWNPKLPKTAWQMGTGVRPDHRGHALGKWIKAAMLRRLVDELPDVEDVRTGNADSNDAMLGINHQLGFKPHIAATTWQVPTETVRAYVDSTA